MTHAELQALIVRIKARLPGDGNLLFRTRSWKDLSKTGADAFQCPLCLHEGDTWIIHEDGRFRCVGCLGEQDLGFGVKLDLRDEYAFMMDELTKRQEIQKAIYQSDHPGIRNIRQMMDWMERMNRDFPDDTTGAGHA